MRRGEADFASLRFSTDALPARDRIPLWREEFGRRVLRLDIEALSDPFRATATLRALPGLRTFAFNGSAVRFDRTKAFTSDGDDSLGLIINLGGRRTLSQRGHDVVLGAGDGVLLLHEQPAALTCTEGSHLGLVLPRAALAERVRNLDNAVLQLIPNKSEALQLLVDYLRLVREEFALATPKLRRRVVGHVHDLVALALGDRGALGETELGAVAAARLAAALEVIATRFLEPELSVTTVARIQGVSPRYLQRLFETTGTTFTDRVTELRLQKAFVFLRDPRNGERVLDIAMQCGFSDISYFNRLFRARFGDTPGAVRARRP